MKKLFFVLAIFFVNEIAAQSGEASITKIETKNETVEITITTTSRFKMGANPYVLYMGDHFFNKSLHPQGSKGNVLVFYVPKGEFNEVQNGSTVFLSYGLQSKSSFQASAKTGELSGKYWKLGKLNKEISGN